MAPRKCPNCNQYVPAKFEMKECVSTYGAHPSDPTFFPRDVTAVFGVSFLIKPTPSLQAEDVYNLAAGASYWHCSR